MTRRTGYSWSAPFSSPLRRGRGFGGKNVETENGFTHGGARPGSGVKPMPKRMKLVDVTVCIPREMRTALNRECGRLGVSRSRLVVVILKRALARRASARAESSS